MTPDEIGGMAVLGFVAGGVFAVVEGEVTVAVSAVDEFDALFINVEVGVTPSWLSFPGNSGGAADLRL